MKKTYAVHPAIGIARVGDSPDDYFIGPEAPDVSPSLNKPGAPSGNGKYKDGQKQIKRQGARFRIYEFTRDDSGAVTEVREITVAEARIDWQVHLANRKPAAPKFRESGRRNPGVPESKLVIDAGNQTISGTSQGMKRLKGTFQGSSDHAIEVPLGDVLTDAAGRLIVLGGFGKSQSVATEPERQKIENFADNDDWCDDSSDGPVGATVRLNGATEEIEADPAWVIVAPPDFAPPMQNVITLYDVVYNVMARFDPSLRIGDSSRVSFSRDIYPIFRRVSNVHWTSDVAAGAHGPGTKAFFVAHLQKLSSNKPEQRNARRQIFDMLRNPAGGGGTMPKLPASTKKDATVALQEEQYKRMQRWAEGEFDADWTGQPPVPLTLEQMPVKDRPQALDRAALEACVGGGFFPGIEVGRIMLEESTYDRKRLFRINTQLAPGTLTARMAVPWQADFFDCSFQDGLDWWPAQRPNQVFRGQNREPWVPEEWEKPERMVQDWSTLGFIVEETGTGRLVEGERSV
jgi:hypothetical protein